MLTDALLLLIAELRTAPALSGLDPDRQTQVIGSWLHPVLNALLPQLTQPVPADLVVVLDRAGLPLPATDPA